ncbi:hypothetical protein [Nocardia sp. NPDC051570]|uniref:hypothetical protein n=1 Tax=Nocardia sp. NPDC051570 TaxID=3364324 RepID=UPI003790EB47
MVGTTAITGVGVSFGPVTTVFATVTAGGRVTVGSRTAGTPESSLVRELLTSVPADVNVVVARSQDGCEPLPARVAPIAAPIAAVEYLEYEYGPRPPRLVLVYDLEATSLDIAVVRVGSGEAVIAGTPVRAPGFSPIPLGEDDAALDEYDGPRAAYVRASFAVIRAGIRSAGVSLDEIDRILLVGSAARAPEVAGVLAELGPVVISADPAHCVAIGAARYAARRATPLTGVGSRRPLALAGAAVAAVVAIAAASLFLPSTGTTTATRTAAIPGTSAAISPTRADALLKAAAQQELSASIETEPSVGEDAESPSDEAPPGRYRAGRLNHPGLLHFP